ncbi:MAG: STAS/SEC14 domain-containing protein [Flammeovirgaceae bacterium]
MLSNNHSYNRTGNFITATYKGFIKLEDFKEICNESLRLMVQKRTEKILVDNTKLLKMPKENEEWIQAEWFPKAIQLGLKQLAFVVAEGGLGEQTTKEANRAVERQMLPINLRYFDSLNEAKTWLAD